jgi:DNA-binding PadR family transcriptional regulator
MRLRRLKPEPMVRVLLALLADEGKGSFGLGLMRDAKVRPGQLYPILTKLAGRGWVEHRLEDIDEETEGRPRRTLYDLTLKGLKAAEAARNWEQWRQ